MSVLLALALALPASAASVSSGTAVSSGTEVSSATATAAAPPVDCTAAAPEPMLRKKAYRGWSFARGPENTAVEKAALKDAALEIQTAGCYDGVEHAFVFTVAKPARAYDDRDGWLAFAAAQLPALKRRGDAGGDDVRELTAFLKKGALKATARESGGELRLEACRDGSAPPDEDGCPFETGGGYRFAVRKAGAAIEVYVSRYVAL